MRTLQIKHITVGEGPPKIIVPLVSTTKAELIQEAKHVKELKPDVVEWRADLFEFVEDLQAVTEMIAAIKNVFTEELFLFTFRTHKEGGTKEISEQDYMLLNQAAIQTGHIDLVDVELFTSEDIRQAIVKTAKEAGVFVIMSNHDFDKTPPKEAMIARLQKMQNHGADLLKIAVMPKSVQDVITLLDATHTMKTQIANRPLITMAMGGLGVVSRLAGEVFGSDFTFAAGKEASAPGQIPIDELRYVLNILHKRM